MKKLTLTAIEGIPLIEPGDDLAEIINQSIEQVGESLQNNDVLVIAQKIVSKSEGRYISLADITPSSEALELALEVEKDARYVQVVLNESSDVVHKSPGVLIAEHKLGFVYANAGVDNSNIKNCNNNEYVLLLPKDPDASAMKLRNTIFSRYGVSVAIIINDSMGRAWRNGTLGLAIGIAGLTALEDYRGEKDMGAVLF